MRFKLMRSWKTRWAVGGLLTAAVVAGLAPQALAIGNIGTAAGFEDNDGDLAPNPATINLDWNSFAPVSWSGATPTSLTASKTLNNGWTFLGLTDAQKSNSDTGFAGGTKQDQNCPVVIGTSAPNKDDLKRVYMATKTGSDGHVYLMLAWIRVPQNTTSPSAHIAFEFNQGTGGCPAGSDGLVSRLPGDLLVLYDFTGGGTTAPTIGLERWVRSGTCAISTDTPPCWGPEVTPLPATQAEAAVDTGAGVFPATARDTLPPTTETLGTNEFGEAGIDLYNAGVFNTPQCTTFGTAWAVSRSSGNSGQAAMEDLVGPGKFHLSNCGEIRIHKVTDNGNGTFGYTTTGGLSPATFSLSNGGLQDYLNIQPGSYSITEGALPAGWSLKNLTCTAAGFGTSFSTSAATANITVAPNGVVDCTYTNHVSLSPTISTTLSTSSVTVGTAVHDSATLTGASTTAGGTVTYTVYSDANCGLNPVSAGTVSVSNGVVPDSSPITFNSAGTFYWQAVYSGDANNAPAKSACTSEILTVSPKSPSISTALSSTSVSIGTTVQDSATLTGATSNAGGTVTYTVYSDANCSLNAQSAGTVTVTNGVVPDSNAITFNSAGTFYWQAVYSGDANNNGATSSCTSEQVVVNKNTPGISTVQSLIPNDSATLFGLTSTAGGAVTFNLFSPNAPTCTGTPALTQTVNVNGNGIYSTTNTTFAASDAGQWRWQVAYSGDDNNNAASSSCGVENFTITDL